MDNRKDKKSNKKSNPLALAVFILIVIANAVDIDDFNDLTLTVVIIAVICIALTVVLVKVGKKKAGSVSSSRSAANSIRETAVGLRNAREAARERASARAVSPEIKSYSRAAAGTKSSYEHSHDRAAGYTAGECTPEEHWKKQLDGFLANGIIDKAEYRLLMKKRTGNY